MTPQTANAYYGPGLNEIVVPAALLQPPLFDVEADDAVNYGALGAAIGHELGHGFDEYGRRFDGTGQIRNWWTVGDEQAFDALARRLIEQYNGYSPLPGAHVNGALTLRENIGDLSGLAIAWRAYQIVARRTRKPPVIDGFSGEQRFFLGWAQAQRGRIRDGVPPADAAVVPARAAAVSRERTRQQHPGVLRRVLRQARRPHVPRRGQTRQDLVRRCQPPFPEVAGTPVYQLNRVTN